jgi:Tfp pilus assembly protein PilN
MKLFSSIWNPSKLVVVFLHLRKDGNLLSACQYKKDGTAMQSLETFESVQTMLKKFGSAKAYWLHVEGSGVLSRLVDRASGYKDDLIINGDKDDFYFSSITDGEKSIVSFVRKNTVSAIEEAFKEAKVHLLGLSCGIVPSVLTVGANGLLKGEFELELRNEKILRFERKEQAKEQVICNDRYMSPQDVTGEGIVGSFDACNMVVDFCWTNELVKTAKEEYVQHKRFNVFGVGSILCVFLIVLVNYFYINQLNQEVAELEEELSLSNNNLSLLGQLEQERSRKEQLVETSGFTGNNFISYYLDKIGQSVPNSITLTTMDVFPLVEKLKEKQKVSVDTKKVQLSGLTASSVVLDDWIEKMNRFSWVKTIEVVNYSKISDAQAEFDLLLTLSK